MDKYNYEESMKERIYEYLDDIDKSEIILNGAEEMCEEFYDRMWNSDTVTGNASGSYFCNAWLAEEAICHNWDLLEEALEEFGCSDVNVIEKGPEWCDVTIRCYLLSQCLMEVLEEIENE